MRSAGNFLRAIFLLLPFLFLSASNGFAVNTDNESADDYAPPVTARVARISFARGEAQIRRAGERDWERAAQNLPLVEGDEITTDANARLEIQFDSRTYLRLAENSYLKITTLKDEGVALSLPQGSLSARVLEFDKARAFFEIDAPKTTVAVERAGMYRVDAGDARKSSEVRVGVTDGGEARLYSETSGFTLRDGRSARIYLDGNNAGEWETSDAARYADDFDAWALERDSVIAKRLQTAAYDKYYDRDVYGAEDLSDYGEWIHTNKYGYVWRPYRNATSGYADWSPYRYGTWRWIPPYGWTWVNDEPWGWATYHHGRWIYVDDNWAWTPYPQHRSRRSWWQPALVVINYVGSNICWYPLPYSYNYYNYNSTYIDRRRTTIINNPTVVVNPTPTPQMPIIQGGGRYGNPRIKRQLPPTGDVIPPTGVVAVEASEFGRGTKGFRTPPIDAARKILDRAPFENADSSVVALPTHSDLNGKISREIAAENPRVENIIPRIQTGATQRKGGASTDENLRQQRIFGGRPPVERTPPAGENAAGEISVKPERRETGAVKRQPRPEIVRGNDGNSESEAPGGRPVRTTGGGRSEDNNGEPISKPRGRDREQTPPSNNPPSETEQPRRERRQEPPQQQEERREQRRESPPERQQAPRSEPPQPRVEPKPQPREEKPPQREERKAEPSAPPPGKQREKESVDKDNR